MASTVFLVNQRGEEVVSRHYRGDISKTSMESFRNKIIATKSTGQAPVVTIDRTSFMYIRHGALFLVAACRLNPNCAMIFEFLVQKLKILKSYLGKHFTDDDVQSNFTLIYELMDECMDFGYPQVMATENLQQFISGGELTPTLATQATGAQLTSQITGTIDWRTTGLKFRENKVNIEVIETVTLVVSATGQILRGEVSGKVMMTTQLSGMPECKFGLNDKLIMEREGGASAVAAQSKTSGVDIDDFTFHRCVRLGKFDTDRTITFIPPHGQFELMKYRVITPAQPFKVFTSITEEGKARLMVNLKVNSDFQEDKKATHVVIKIPMPTSAATARISVGRGRAKYEPGERALVWKISSFPGNSESSLTAVVDLLPSIREKKQWIRPPVTLDFQIPMYSCSGVQVRFLKVYDKSNYVTQRWVKYLSKAGEYQMRI